MFSAELHVTLCKNRLEGRVLLFVPQRGAAHTCSVNAQSRDCGRHRMCEVSEQIFASKDTDFSRQHQLQCIFVVKTNKQTKKYWHGAPREEIGSVPNGTLSPCNLTWSHTFVT